MRARRRLRPAAAWRSAARQPLGDRLAAACLLVAFAASAFDPYRQLASPLWMAAGAVMTGALAWRLGHPLRVWAIATVAGTLLLATRPPLPADPMMPVLLLPAPLIALYTVAAHTRQRTGLLALAGSGVALLTGLDHGGTDSPTVALTLVISVSAWALGARSRSRRQELAALADRAAALDAERAERDRAAAASERARIAGELHDIIAHHICVVVLQAGAARMLAEAGRTPDATLLGGIEATSREAMGEIRQALGVIRGGAGGAAPMPGTARLPDLAERMALAGLPVTIDGAAGSLPAGLDLAVYRVVQEGLTNVLRHSAARSAAVTLRRGAGALEVTVTDGGPARQAPAAGPGGYGLAGLRERLAPHGGELLAGSRPGGGFELRARLPVAPRNDGGPVT